jgi:hypothetical protein
MRRVLLLIAAGVISAVVVLGAGGHSRSAPASHSRNAANQAARRFTSVFGALPWHNQAPPRGLRLTLPRSVPRSNGGTCEIASGRCSLSPCVDPIIAAPRLPLNGFLSAPARRPAVPACRHPKSRLSRTSSA